MSIKLQFDSSKNVVEPTLVLAKRNGDKLAKLPASDLYTTSNFNSYSEFTCTVNKFDNGVEYPFWDELRDFRCIYIPTWDVWFELRVTTNEDDAVKKNLICRTLAESELSQVILYNVEINSEDDIARDDYKATVLYNPQNTDGSLLHRVLSKVPHYSIGHVDSTIANIQRTFKFNGKSVYDALQEVAEEINCIFIFNSGSDENGKPAREINAYDLNAYCINCGYRDEFTDTCPKCGSTNVRNGYGDDTTIFVSVDNLAEEIEYETDVDSVKNCFKLEAGDDLMTATVISANPNGSPYIWYISDEAKEDMSAALVEKLNQYDEQYEYYNSEYELDISSDMISAYNQIVTKYLTYDSNLNAISDPLVGYSDLTNAYYNTVDLYYLLNNSLMPTVAQSDTSASAQAALLTTANISPVAVQSLSTISAYTANSAVFAVAKVLIDKRYQVKVKTCTFSDNTWTGNFIVTNLSDEEDTAESNTISVTVNGDYTTYLEQKIKKLIKTDSDESGTDIGTLFAISQPQFDAELRKWSLTRLGAFRDSCRAVIDMMIDQGISNDDRWNNQTPNLYQEMYLPYYNKLLAIEAEIAVRENEINVIAGKFDERGNVVEDGLQTLLEKERKAIHDALNFQEFIGDDLWREFASHRREDTYKNDNYVSDGLTNEELLDMADGFLAEAQKEIYKSATLQHKISATLRNLLAMPEFDPIVDYFEVGNWIRIKVDGRIYRLRLLSYSVDFNDLQNLKITFSDVKQYKDGVSDSESIMSQARSMASSYDAVTRQAKKGKKSNETLRHWVEDGLALTNMKIIGSADNQNVTWDKNGILCREYLPITDNYSDKQLKIINKGLYVTDDNWRTSKAGIGNFTFYNPQTGQEEEAYGVIAETLVGNLILSQEVGIYNTTGSIVINENGLEIISDMTEDTGNPLAFSVGRKYINSDGNEQTDRAIYTDSDGNVVISGNVKINPSVDYDISSIDDLCNPDEMHKYVEKSIIGMADLLNTQMSTYYNKLLEYTQDVLTYKNTMKKYVYIDEDKGIVVSGYDPQTLDVSIFKTLIDNESIKFFSDSSIVAFVNHDLLYISNAEINNTLRIGKFFIFPRNDNGVSINWAGEYIPKLIDSNGYVYVGVDENIHEELVGSGEGGSSGESGNSGESQQETGTFTSNPTKAEMLALIEEVSSNSEEPPAPPEPETDDSDEPAVEEP